VEKSPHLNPLSFRAPPIFPTNKKKGHPKMEGLANLLGVKKEIGETILALQPKA